MTKRTMQNKEPIGQVRREILRVFVDRDLSILNDRESVLVQRIVANLVNPSPLSRMNPKEAEYREVLGILQKTPMKQSNYTPSAAGDFGPAEISLVLQGLDYVEANAQESALHQRMRSVLKSMAKGNTRIWRELSQSLDPEDISVFGFLKDALQRAKSPDAGRMESAPKKRSQKRFWDGGVSI